MTLENKFEIGVHEIVIISDFVRINYNYPAVSTEITKQTVYNLLAKIHSDSIQALRTKMLIKKQKKSF